LFENKTKIISGIIGLKISLYIVSRKEDIMNIYGILLESQYVTFFEELIKMTLDTLEYVVSLN
jgi:hypothetical protein